MNRDPTSIFPLPSVKLRALKRTWQEGEIFLPGSPGIEYLCLQAPGAPASVPALLGVCEAQLSLAFGCSVLGPALATVVEWGGLCPAQVTASLHSSPQPSRVCTLWAPSSWPSSELATQYLSRAVALTC